MSRPTLEQTGFREIAEQSDTAIEALDAALCWVEKEIELASNTFDKARQGRLATLAITHARIAQALYYIKSVAKERG